MDDPRKAPDVAREYRSDEIVVRWEAQRCTHAAKCLRKLPAVFDSAARPWIRLEEGTADEVAEAVSGCPTGALTFERLDGGAQEDWGDVTIVEPELNGPLYVRGKIRIVDDEGNVRELTRAALCRCGASQNKPFCDDSHARIKFRSRPPKPKPRLGEGDVT